MNNILNDKDNCCGCHACFNICPQQAIEMVEDEKGFKHPLINEEKCIKCELCKKVCPILNVSNQTNEIISYAGYNKSDDRINSSSGGIFILIAKTIIKERGVVFGACLDEKFKVCHIKAETESELKKLMGSKYVQSNIGNTYKEVKEELLKNRKVLFTGTPCQVEGLKSFLMKDYENLYTQDVICHGVPSPLVWEKYKEYRKKMDKDEPKEINFRNKDNGWILHNIKFVYEEKVYRKNQNEDMFMQAFLRNTILRDSCYNCHFKKLNRISDITLADYWGVQNEHPELFDNKGTSLIIVNSVKGKELFGKIEGNIVYQKTDLTKALKYNPAMTKLVNMDNKREEFFNHIDELEFITLVKKYTSYIPFYKKVLNKLKRIVKNLIGRV